MGPLYSKPKGMKYTDLCIYIDKTFYTPERDDETCFKYMYAVAYMLASKAKYFTDPEDYNGFAFYLAYSTYQRFADTTKVPLKSVLNYMKSIMYFRKMAYNNETFSEVIDPVYSKGWDGGAYTEKTMSTIEANNKQIVQMHVEGTIKSLPVIIKECIPKSYKNTNLYNNIYISALLSFLYRITLPEANGDYLEDKLKSSDTFNDVNYYNKHIDKDSVILWGLSDTLEDVVRLVLNKARIKFSDEIGETTSEYSLTPETYKAIMNDEIFSDSEQDEY